VALALLRLLWARSKGWLCLLLTSRAQCFSFICKHGGLVAVSLQGLDQAMAGAGGGSQLEDLLAGERSEEEREPALFRGRLVHRLKRAVADMQQQK
jgi:hypothetical protein